MGHAGERCMLQVAWMTITLFLHYIHFSHWCHPPTPQNELQESRWAWKATDSRPEGGKRQWRKSVCKQGTASSQFSACWLQPRICLKEKFHCTRASQKGYSSNWQTNQEESGGEIVHNSTTEVGHPLSFLQVLQNKSCQEHMTLSLNFLTIKSLQTQCIIVNTIFSIRLSIQYHLMINYQIISLQISPNC